MLINCSADIKVGLDTVGTVYHLVIYRVFTNEWCSFKS